MKKMFIFLAMVCLFCTNAYADQADDLIATLNVSDKASVFIAFHRIHYMDEKIS